MQNAVSFEQAAEARFPRDLVIAIAKDPAGKYNPITLGIFTHVTQKPPVLAIAISTENYSLQTIRLAREFTVAFPSVKQAAEATLYGTRSGRDCDKLKLANAKTARATQIDSVLLTDAVCNFECKLVNEITIGNHVLIFGEVVASHIHSPPLQRLYILRSDYTLGALHL